ncbi:MAG: mechanosensitive ion channel family protein [Muribaculaceae bacterium]|nr:mechanosensitive ion channel family protein [Muribaculaceae bacterium]
MLDYLRHVATEIIPASWPSWLSIVILCAGVALVAVLTYYIAIYFLRIVEKVISRTPTTWDDDLLNRRILRAISQLAPAITVNWLLPALFGHTPQTFNLLSTLTSFYILWAVIHVLTVFVDNLYGAMSRRPKFKAYAVKGFFQMFKIIFIGVGVIIGLSMLIGKTPMTILTALGASAAVLSLVFKDTILGLVASVQLTANHMLHRGDWIIVPGLDANGEVTDISLTTVKVRNWDNSVTTVPPYSLISGPFRNYSPMKEAGARRVDRAIYIDINSVRYLSEEEVDSLAAEGFLSEEERNGGRAVNLGLMRRYLERLIGGHPLVSSSSTLMVRQLEPTPSGLPVQMYFFITDTNWVAYEHCAAEIMDEIYATVSRFGLRIFQTPAGTDLHPLAKK